MNNFSRPNHKELFNVQPVANNNIKQINSYEPAKIKNSNGPIVLLAITSLIGALYAINAVKEQNKTFEDKIREIFKSINKNQEKEN